MPKYTIIKDSHDSRDLIYSVEVASLPIKVDLRKKMSPIVDQGQLGSCTANAIVSGLKEYWLRRDCKRTRLSRLFLYYYERQVEGTVNEDSGAMLRDGMKVLQKTGVCPEKDFPYDISKFTNAPTAKANADAAKYKIATYQRVSNLDALKHSIASGSPVVFGFNVYDSFESQAVANTGIVPVPDKHSEQNLGGHAVIAVGYDDTKQVVIVRNSWGTNWGDKGYCYMPYAMWSNGIVMDMWTGK